MSSDTIFAPSRPLAPAAPPAATSVAPSVDGDSIDTAPADLRLAARVVARQEVADAVAAAMADYGGSSHDFQRDTGIDPAVISRLVNGRLVHGGTVATLAHIALALGKTLRISID